MPSRLCKTTACWRSSSRKASAKVWVSPLLYTPKTCAVGCNGLTKGPIKLKIVRIPKLLRIAPTAFIAGCQLGANKKVIPTAGSAS